MCGELVILHLSYLLGQELIFLCFLYYIQTESIDRFILPLDVIPQFNDFLSLSCYRPLLLVNQPLILKPLVGGFAFFSHSLLCPPF